MLIQLFVCALTGKTSRSSTIQAICIGHSKADGTEQDKDNVAEVYVSIEEKHSRWLDAQYANAAE